MDALGNQYVSLVANSCLNAYLILHCMENSLFLKDQQKPNLQLKSFFNPS